MISFAEFERLVREGAPADDIIAAAQPMWEAEAKHRESERRKKRKWRMSRGQSRGQSRGHKKPNEINGRVHGTPAVVLSLNPEAIAKTAEAQLFSRGREVLGQTSGGLINKVLQAEDGVVPHARAVIERASTADNPREFIGGYLRKRGRENGRALSYNESVDLASRKTRQDWLREREGK